MEENENQNTLSEKVPYNTDLINCPVWEKYALSVLEASAYFNIGMGRVREMVREDMKKPEPLFTLMVGSRYLIKREKLQEVLNSQKCI